MTSLTLVRRIRARPQIVFDAVTTAEGIAQWWGPDAGPVLLSESDPRVGGRYRVRLHGEWITVPENALVTEPNKYGPAVVWPYMDANGATQIRCFLPGAGA